MTARTNPRLELLRRVDSANLVLEKVLKEATDPMGAVLRVHLFTEQVLEVQIRESLPHPDALLKRERMRYSQKLAIVESIAALDPTSIKSLKALNKVRNKCAHKLGYEVSASDVDSFGAPFGDSYSYAKRAAGDNFYELIGRTCSLLGGYLAAELRGRMQQG